MTGAKSESTGLTDRRKRGELFGEGQPRGYEKSEQLDVKPVEYFVVATMREKRACKACEEQGVECAPVPVRIIEKGLASDRIVIDTVFSKYADHQPLYCTQ